jgi:hypothetical protein
MQSILAERLCHLPHNLLLADLNISQEKGFEAFRSHEGIRVKAILFL